jgi:predicted ATPase
MRTLLELVHGHVITYTLEWLSKQLQERFSLLANLTHLFMDRGSTKDRPNLH